MFGLRLPGSLASAMDERVDEVLHSAGVSGPPVDVLAVARAHEIPVVQNLAQQPRGQHARLGGRAAIFVRPDGRPERLQWTVAHELGEAFAHRVFDRLGASDVPPREREQVANLLAARLLLPTEWFFFEAGRCQGDVPQLKHVFATASHELVALRLLDLPTPTVITVFDQKRMSRRRCNHMARAPELSALERDCWQTAHYLRRVTREHDEGTVVQAWPIHEPGWQREILRTTFLRNREVEREFGDDSE